MQRRERAERLGGHPPLGGHHGQLTALGADHAATHPDEVAQVHVGLPCRQGLLAHLGEAQHHLQPLTGIGMGEAVLQRGEGQLAGVADEHDAATDGHLVGGLLTGGQVPPGGADRCQGVAATKIGGVGLLARLQDALALVAPNLHLLGNRGPLDGGDSGLVLALLTHRHSLS